MGQAELQEGTVSRRNMPRQAQCQCEGSGTAVPDEEGQESVTGSVCRGKHRAPLSAPKPPRSGWGQRPSRTMAGDRLVAPAGLGGCGRWLCPGKGRRLAALPARRHPSPPAAMLSPGSAWQRRRQGGHTSLRRTWTRTTGRRPGSKACRQC
ncbi:hypothetical protein Nmel_003429 [Mimus melanotis]